MRVGKSSHTDRQNYDMIAKESERSKIPIDYEHNQTGLHEITICDGRSKVEKQSKETILSLVWKKSRAVENFYFLLIGNGNKQQQQKQTDSQLNFQ